MCEKNRFAIATDGTHGQSAPRSTKLFAQNGAGHREAPRMRDSSKRCPKPGDVVGKKYRVERTLHTGPVAVVVSARHILLDEPVVLKVLVPEAAGDPRTTQRLVQEARVAARIRSPHVTRIFDVVLGRCFAYIVMEHLSGCNVAEWLAQEGRLSFQQAVDIVLPVCEVLAEAHRLDYVHRDLKPENLFMVRKPGMADVVKVLDFGIVKVPETGSAPGRGSIFGHPCTEQWTVMGSPRYMAPEQMESAQGVDTRADIWALGAILYELIAGTVPFAGNSLIEIYSKIATLPPPPLCASLGCPAALEAIIVRCLARWPAGRYSDAAELALALAQFGSDRSAASLERIRCGLTSDALDRAAFTAHALPMPASHSVALARRSPIGDDTLVSARQS